MLIISVEDTGRGIAPDKMKKLFTKFNRLEEDKNTSLEGTGLGLVITKNLVEMMDGKIEVQSEYGKGSKFTVYLSQIVVNVEEDSSVEKNINSESDLDYSDKKILIVDDNTLNVKVLARLLKNYGIIPDTCNSGPECIDKVKESNEYDIIFMDYMMPEMDGIETLQHLKEIPDFKTKVVAVTADAIEGSREKFISSGFDDYIAKPVKREFLEKVIKNS